MWETEEPEKKGQRDRSFQLKTQDRRTRHRVKVRRYCVSFVVLFPLFCIGTKEGGETCYSQGKTLRR